MCYFWRGYFFFFPLLYFVCQVVPYFPVAVDDIKRRPFNVLLLIINSDVGELFSDPLESKIAVGLSRSMLLE